MLNLKLGRAIEADGRMCVLTTVGSIGHALYGPYSPFEAGRYAVEFDLAAQPGAAADPEAVCGTVDVVARFGALTLAESAVTWGQLADPRRPVQLVFDLAEDSALEFRFLTNGSGEVLVGDSPRVVRVENPRDVEALLARERFPGRSDPARTPFFEEQLGRFRNLYQNGCRIEARDGTVVVTIRGVSFHARQIDDMRFVEEIFSTNEYNFISGHATCVIDVGMNIGLASLMFASKAEVRQVYSFEPVPDTYGRALANLALNPDLAAKIVPHNFGLAGRDEHTVILIDAGGDSGAHSATIARSEGSPTPIELKAAASFLAPLVKDAIAKGQQVVAKIDCEGAEFDVFDSLGEAGLIESFTAFMVEWHPASGRTARSLIARLTAHGFLVVDVSPSPLMGNGFFYAVRTATS